MQKFVLNFCITRSRHCPPYSKHCPVLARWRCWPYLDTPCAVMSPNPRRYAALKELVQEFSADAVVDLTWQDCHTYDVESHSMVLARTACFASRCSPLETKRIPHLSFV